MTIEEDQSQPVDETPLIDAPLIDAPDPSGPPQPVNRNDSKWRVIATVGVSTVALGGLFIPAFLNLGRTSGATRSAKIQWEQRQRQIEQVIQEDQAAQAATIAGPEGADPKGEAPDNDGDTK